MKRLFVLAMTLFLMACTSVHVQTWAPSVVDEAYVRHIDDTVVKLTSENPMVLALCSGVVYAPGVVLTAAHCNFPELQVEWDGRQYPVADAQKVGERDLLVLTVPGIQCPCAERPLAPAKEREDAVIIGYPGGALKAIVGGKILGRWTYEEHDYNGETTFSSEFLVASTHVTSGNSGGGLFIWRDGKFWLVGIVSRGHPSGIPVLAEELKAGDL